MVNNQKYGHPNPFVNARNELPWPPPTNGEEFQSTRKIDFQVWDLDEIQTLAKRFLEGETGVIRAVTSDCIHDMQEEKIGLDFAADLLLMLEPDHYLNSQWCTTGGRASVKCRPELRWVPCDAYCLPCEIDCEDGRTIEKKYYLKLARAVTGTMLLLVSLHPSNF